MLTPEEARNEGWETWLDSGTLSYQLEGVFMGRGEAVAHFEHKYGRPSREGFQYRIRQRGSEYGLYVY